MVLLSALQDVIRSSKSGNDSADSAALVLIVEDSPTQALALQKALQKEGISSERTASAEDALEFLRKQIPDLAIVDHHLPGMEGVELCRLLRQNPATEKMPLLMLTNDPQAELERRGLESGADDHLHKTADKELLMARVHTLLRKAALLAQSGAGSGAGFHSPHILAVSANPAFVEHLGSALRQTGCEFEWAGNVEAGIAYVAGHSLDCIVIDPSLPGFDAVEVCNRVSRLRNASRLNFPILVVSRDEESPDDVRFLEAGADDVIAHSVSVELVVARIRAQLRRKGLLDEAERIQSRFRDVELEVLRERAERQAAEERAQLADDLQKAHVELKDAYAELQDMQVQLIQSAKMSSLGELVAGIAHEVNNPLAYTSAHLNTVIQVMDKLKAKLSGADVTGVDTLIEKGRQRSLEAKEGIERVVDLVARLRTFSRLDEGEFKDADIAECIESALNLITHKIDKKNIDVNTEYSENDWLFCAPGILNQVIINLLSNAIDAVGDEGIIRVKTGRNSQIYFISVGDNGPGVSDETAARIFEPFFTTKQIGCGTGIGLSISYRIIERHHGTIKVLASDLGGAEFRVEIPLDLEERIHADQH